MKKIALLAIILFWTAYVTSVLVGYNDYIEYIKGQPNRVFENVSYYNLGKKEALVVQTQFGERYKHYWEVSVIEKELSVEPYLLKVKKTMSVFEFMMVGRQYNVDTHYKPYLILDKKN